MSWLVLWCLLAGSHMGQAATRTWTGGTSGVFTNSANWLSGNRPIAGDDLLFSAGATFRTVTNASGVTASNYASIILAGTNYVIGATNAPIFSAVNLFSFGFGGASAAGTNRIGQRLNFSSSANPPQIEVTESHSCLVLSNGVNMSGSFPRIMKTGAGTVIAQGTNLNNPYGLILNGGTWMERRANSFALGTNIFISTNGTASRLNIETNQALESVEEITLHENGVFQTSDGVHFPNLSLTMKGGLWTNSGTAYAPTNATFLASASTAQWKGANFIGINDMTFNVANGAAGTDVSMIGSITPYYLSKRYWINKTGGGNLQVDTITNAIGVLMSAGIMGVSNLHTWQVQAFGGVNLNLNNTIILSNLHAKMAVILGSGSNYARSLTLESPSQSVNSGQLFLGGDVTCVGATNLINTSLTLVSNAPITFSNPGGALRINGTLNATTNALQMITTTSSNLLVFGGTVSGAPSASAIFGISTGELRMVGTNLTGHTVVSGSAARLSGTGRLNRATVIYGAKLCPGIGLGTIYVDNDLQMTAFSGTGILELELSATNNHDRVVTTAGMFNLSFNSVTHAGLSVILTNFSAPPGAVFKVVEVAGTSGGRNGIFAGLTEGASFTVDGTTFRISYFGGDGNDITLTIPQVAASPSISGATRNGGNLTLSLTNIIGAVNYLEACTNLTAPIQWLRVATNTTPGSGGTNFVIPLGAVPMRLFRLASP